jgi:hypothetical protein
MNIENSLGNSLKPFIRICNDLGLPYWIDSGTLLGLYRDGSLISWDDDIDIGMWQQDLIKLHYHTNLLNSEGLQVKKQIYDKQMYSLTITSSSSDHSLPIHIHGYYLDNDLAWAPQVVACQPKPAAQPSWVTEHPSKTRDFLLWCKKFAKRQFDGDPTWYHALLARTLCMGIWGLFYILKEPLDRKKWETFWPFRLIYQMYTWKIPANFFLKLETFNIGEHSFYIPSKPSVYLQLRYGNWTTPNQHWVYWRDDGSIYDESPVLGKRR